MAETHLQINADGSTVMRKTVLWPSTVSGREEVLKSIFSRDNWEISRLYNVAGPHWKIEVSCQHVSYKINLYISSVRDEARQDDEFKMQLGGTYPTGNEDGWITLILGIYAIADDDENIVDYILSAYSSKNLDFSGNPSIRGTRTNGLQMARILGFYKTEKSYLFRPEFLYFYIQNQELLDVRSTAISRTEDIEQPKQIIFFGAPGTGKSHGIKNYLFKLGIGEEKDKTNVFRTTFHPDSDYSTFVGCYKPTMEYFPKSYTVEGIDKPVQNVEGTQVYKEKIVYRFIPQTFIKAYIKAYNSPDEPVVLIIEEINRGNCAQIFGDLFQLLDRKLDGTSEYPIKADDDLCKFLLEGKDKDGHDILQKKEGIANGELSLPKNLYIWATMNTSDQSLFPIDSAFKRRWQWRYVKISKGIDETTKQPLNWTIDFDYKDKEGAKHYICDWWEFIKAINEKIAAADSSDDKKLGYFFCKPTSGTSIDEETFVSKVIFYLWTDVFKDNDNEIFRIDGEPSFDIFYKEDENGYTVVDTNVLYQFMQKVFDGKAESATDEQEHTSEEE